MGRPEDKYVKIPAIIQATRVGYTYRSIKHDEIDVDYDGYTNIFFEDFRAALEHINGRTVSEEHARHLVSFIKDKLPGINLGRAFFEDLQSSMHGCKLIDFEHPQNNTFTVVTELPYANGEDNFRPDITFLVNGMPLGFMEVKRPNNKDGLIAEYDRMHARFKNPAFQHFANITQVMAFSNNQEYDDEERKPVTGSFYASSAYGHLSFNHFREEDPDGMAALVSPADEKTARFICEDNNLASYYGSNEYETALDPNTPANRMVTSLFSPERFLFLLHYGICYVNKADGQGSVRPQKHVMRYPQLFATNAVRRLLDSGGTKGVIWHTQGSGKTALAYFLTPYLRDYYQAQGRTTRFFFIVDRLDLAEQAKNEFEARGATVVTVSDRKEFAQIIGKPVDNKSVVTRGHKPTITVVNIQKFGSDPTPIRYDYNLDVQRVYFIDEAHRDYKSNGAFLANLETSDRNAVKIALTGTPLVNQGKNDTKQVFGPYIHTYYYNRSIADGYTLKLLREDIKTTFVRKMKGVIEDLTELKQLVNMEEVFAHPSYVEPLCDYISEDLINSRAELADDSIGAMIVAHSAKQARAIFKCMNDSEPDLECELILHDEGTKESRKGICDGFRKDDSKTDILIVYNMLLTGFDAHRLKKLYLCRTIKAHNLLQALTRVNRPYKDMAYGYVVDFADITEEYDKTNRAYLAELTGELGDAAEEYSSLFEDRETIKADLAKVRDTLFSYTQDNVVEFQQEVDAITDKKELYALRNALTRYRELRNVAIRLGYEDLYGCFDIGKASEMLREVSSRIQTLNFKDALALKDMSTGAINLLLSNIEFNFQRIAQEEMKIADEFDKKLRRTYAACDHNIDNKDPEYVNLLNELKERFAKLNIEELTSTEMTEHINALDRLYAKIEELNRRNIQAAKRYGGDEKFVRIQNWVMRTPPPITSNLRTLASILSDVKFNVDDKVMHNHNLLDNERYFERVLGGIVTQACKSAQVSYSAEQLMGLVSAISKEYFDERGRAA